MSGQRADQGLWLKDLRWRGLARAIGKPSLQLYLDCPTRTANFLQRLGFSGTAERWLRRVYAAHPYDLALGEYLSNLMFQNRGHEFCEGTVERGRFLMQVFMGSYPSSRVIEAYFRNLKKVLLARAQPAVQGQVVVGLGAGRCGSTTLAAVLHSIDGSISTHENPPLIFWEPTTRQVQFHLERLRIFSRHFPLVSDCAHWWINLFPTILEAFPNTKAIGLWRETDACVRSWMDSLPEDTNHWVAPYNHIWPSDAWDPCFPHYDLPEGAERDRRGARAIMIERYVSDYNERLRALTAGYPRHLLLLRTEELDLAATRDDISEFLGLPVTREKLRLNLGTMTDHPSADELYF
jgi:hypothetical protein